MCPRQHLAVRVDLYPGARGLFEQVAQVEQVVPGDENARPLLNALGHFRHFRCAEGLHVPVVQQLHRPQVHPPALEHHLEQGVHVEVDVGHGGEQRLLDESVHFGVGLAEPARVVLVGGHALQPVQQDFLKRFHVRVFADRKSVV